MAHSRIARRDQSEHAAVGTGAQAELVDGGFQELVGFFFNGATALDVFSPFERWNGLFFCESAGVGWCVRRSLAGE